MRQKKKIFKTYNPGLASLLIRFGLAAVFVYAAISAFLEPRVWLVYVPEFVDNFMDVETALRLISVAQLVLAAWLLWGRYLKYAAMASAAFLAGLLIFNPDTLVITFRDFGLIGASLALIFLDE